MQRHSSEELLRFLEAVDRHLEAPERIVMIGGAAAALAYGARRATIDIDLITTLSPELERAIARAGSEAGTAVPVSFVGVWDGPYDYERRLEGLHPRRWERLRVLVPEKHDLALMKTVRAYEHDVEVIEEIHARNPLQLQVLVERYRDEMSHVTADPATLRTSLLLVIDALFGQDAAERVEAQLSAADGDGSR